MLLRLCSYNLGVNITDKKKQYQLPRLLSRLHASDVHIICFQETRPHAKAGYLKHHAVEEALQRSPYMFGTGGNCSTGGQHLISSEACRSFPRDTTDKYNWRMFSRALFMHSNLRVMVLNVHTRAGQGRNDTANQYRIEFVDHCRKCCEEAIDQGLADLIVVAGDFNMEQPWKSAATTKFERHMTIEDADTKFHHLVPDHLVVYAANRNIQLVECNTSAVAPVGAAHDGVGDHAAIIKVTKKYRLRVCMNKYIYICIYIYLWDISVYIVHI